MRRRVVRVVYNIIYGSQATKYIESAPVVRCAFFDLSVSASEARAVYLFCLIDIHKRVGVDVADNLFQKGGLSFFYDADKHFSFGIGINAFASDYRCAAVQNLNLMLGFAETEGLSL